MEVENSNGLIDIWEEYLESLPSDVEPEVNKNCEGKRTQMAQLWGELQLWHRDREGHHSATLEVLFIVSKISVILHYFLRHQHNSSPFQQWHLLGTDMIDHKCFFVYVRKVISELNLIEEVKRSIKSTPFGHFLDCPAMWVDSALLDDICGHWVEGKKFQFGGDNGQVLEVIVETLVSFSTSPTRAYTLSWELEIMTQHYFEITYLNIQWTGKQWRTFWWTWHIRRKC